MPMIVIKSLDIRKTIDLIVPTGIAMVAIIAFFYIHPGMRFLFLPALAVAYICYFFTSYRVMPDPGRALSIYLLALAVQLLHFAEEFVYGFPKRIAELLDGMPPFNANTFVAFNMVAYCLFLLGGLGMYKGLKFSMIIVWFFTIAGVIGNAIWHPIFALRVGGYFPGLYTSFVYWLLGPILVKQLWKVK